jgi:hypothetical protein
MEEKREKAAIRSAKNWMAASFETVYEMKRTRSLRPARFIDGAALSSDTQNFAMVADAPVSRSVA